MYSRPLRAAPIYGNINCYIQGRSSLTREGERANEEVLEACGHLERLSRNATLNSQGCRFYTPKMYSAEFASGAFLFAVFVARMVVCMAIDAKYFRDSVKPIAVRFGRIVSEQEAKKCQKRSKIAQNRVQRPLAVRFRNNRPQINNLRKISLRVSFFPTLQLD